ncbi:MAG: hypothetical protein ABIH49_00435 [archaeon]
MKDKKFQEEMEKLERKIAEFFSDKNNLCYEAMHQTSWGNIAPVFEYLKGRNYAIRTHGNEPHISLLVSRKRYWLETNPLEVIPNA